MQVILNEFLYFFSIDLLNLQIFFVIELKKEAVP